MSKTAEPPLPGGGVRAAFDALRLFPETVQLHEIGLAGAAPCRRQGGFDMLEPRRELGVGAAQGGFGIGSEMTREVDASEQKIAKLLGNRRFRRLRPDRLPKFGHLFAHLREYRLDSGPVEADPSRTLL